MGELVTRWVKIGIYFVAAWFVIWAYNSIGCRKMEGGEMEPTMKHDEFRLIFPKAFRPNDPIQFNDVVYFEYEQKGRSQANFGGRVIGLPGDRIRIQEGDVYRNDGKIDQSYVASSQKTTETLAEIIVPRDCMYVLADNRREFADLDSRGIGPIGMWSVEGRMRQ
jgi:signal peptidase I